MIEYVAKYEKYVFVSSKLNRFVPICWKKVTKEKKLLDWKMFFENKLLLSDVL